MFCLMVNYSSDLKVELDLEELQPRVGPGGQARYNKKSFSTAFLFAFRAPNLVFKYYSSS